MLLLREGVYLQRMYVVTSLAEMISLYKEEALNRVLPLLSDKLKSFESEIQMLFAEQVLDIINRNLLSDNEIATHILPIVIVMLSSREEDVTGEWMDILPQILVHVHESKLDGLISLALKRGELSERVPSRIVACHMIGMLSSKLPGPKMERTLFDRAMDACQDTDFEIRRTMGEQLQAIARCVGSNLTVSRILSEVMELMSDEEVTVRMAAFKSLIEMYDLLDENTRSSKVMPFVRTLCSSVPEDMLRVVATHFGNLCLKVMPSASDDDVVVFVSFFKDLSSRSEVEPRLLCAYNFPAVLKAIGARRYALHLHGVLTSLVGDSNMHVRLSVAAGIHEVMIILGKERGLKYVKDLVVTLLSDEVDEVRVKAVSHINEILANLQVSHEESRTAAYNELFPLIVKMFGHLRSRWRPTWELLNSAASFGQYFGWELLVESLVPILFQLMSSGAYPARIKAGQVLCHYLRHIKSSYIRAELVYKLIHEFARGKSHSQRVVFIHICTAVLDTHSRVFFKNNFMNALLELVKDKVPNVRLLLTGMMPRLKSILRLPRDANFLDRLNEVMQTLRNDSDRDVADKANTVTAIMKGMEVKTDNVALGSSESPEDIVDVQREAEEKALLDGEDKNSRRHLDYKSRMHTYGGSGMTMGAAKGFVAASAGSSDEIAGTSGGRGGRSYLGRTTVTSSSVKGASSTSSSEMRRGSGSLSVGLSSSSSKGALSGSGIGSGSSGSSSVRSSRTSLSKPTAGGSTSSVSSSGPSTNAPATLGAGGEKAKKSGMLSGKSTAGRTSLSTSSTSSLAGNPKKRL